MAEIEKPAILRELLARKKAREHLLDFVEYTFPQYEASRHHRLIAEHLEAVERGEIKRLMIEVAPRHGKSQLASRHFPAWFIGRNPDKQIITVSANSDLASDFGRDVRNLVADPEYVNVFGEDEQRRPNVSLAADSKAAGKWHTNKGGVYTAAGVGGMITGRGAHLLLLDDLVPGREEADSIIERNKIGRWYSSQAFPRLMPDAAIIYIGTRWHDDDQAGRLKLGAEEWTVITLRALIETQAQAEQDVFQRKVGEALWPEWFSAETLKNTKKVIDPRDWSALYQCDPISEEGAYFKSDFVQYYDELPETLSVFGASDYAVSEGKGDWTVHGVAGVDQHDDLYIIDWWRDRQGPDIWIDAMLDMMDRWTTLKWAEESGQILKSLGPLIQRRMEERGVYGQREQFASTKDKGVRCQAFRGRFAMKKVYFPRNKPWTTDLVNEMMKFTGNQDKEDDQIDVLSLFGRMLQEMRGFVPTVVTTEKPLNHGSNVISLLDRKDRKRRYA